MKPLLIFILLILLLSGSLACGEIPENQKYNYFFWDPVKAHIEKYGAGIDMPGIWADGKVNQQLRKKPRKKGR